MPWDFSETFQDSSELLRNIKYSLNNMWNPKQYVQFLRNHEGCVRDPEEILKDLARFVRKYEGSYVSLKKSLGILWDY
jgi:hypothetical protein